MRPLKGPRRQRGVALIIALILVALATILATKLSFDSWIEQRRTVGIIASEQALQFAMGAEALAGDALSQMGGTGSISLDQPWAQPTQPMPLTPSNDPEGEPIGTLQGALEDMQGRFNLNNLVRTDMTATSGQAGDQSLKQFERLLALVQLEPKWAGIARDWIDANDQPSSPDGAEDSVYTSQNPPYRASNWPMTSPAELLNMPGFGAERYRKIAPYVTALPTFMAKINICTAPAAVLESLSDGLSGEFTDEMLVQNRKNGCFPDKTTLTATMGGMAKFTAMGGELVVADTTNYFMLTTRVTLGTTEFTLYSLLYRGTNGGKVTPLLRTFGTT
jgi:general secretion pathway protein K